MREAYTSRLSEHLTQKENAYDMRMDVILVRPNVNTTDYGLTSEVRESKFGAGCQGHTMKQQQLKDSNLYTTLELLLCHVWYIYQIVCQSMCIFKYYISL